mgnify:CR=1 FL=1
MKALIASVSVAAVAALGLGSASVGNAAPAPATAVAPASARAAAANVCTDTPLATMPAGIKPGNLLADPQDVTAESTTQTGRVYRILYATTGEGGSIVPSCGLVAVPDGNSISGVVAWAHGTDGLKQDCQPSNNPAKNFVGPMFAGIGPVTKKGAQSDGALYNMLKDGYAVVATDYPSGLGNSGMQRYVLGVAEGLAVLDSARAVTNNAAQFGLSNIATNAQLPLVTWGHSQGGGSALWAGQLAKSYLSAMGDQTLNLAGVAAEAPATQFTTSPGQPASYMGNHLGDRDMYNTNPGLGVPFPIGVALFSFVTASWSKVQNGTAGQFPVAPTNKISHLLVLTADGNVTAPVVAANCLNLKGLLPVYVTVRPYLKPDTTRFFAEPFGGSSNGGVWTGGIDATCASPKKYSQAVQDWCAWLQYNMPGPYGVNNFAKLPLDNKGNKVPILLAQGLDDRIIWCVDTQGQVQGANCLTDQFFHSLKPGYCDGSGYLNAAYFPGVSHLGIPAAIATKPNTTTYNGSPLDLFMHGAMKGNLAPGCSADLDGP